MNNINIRSRLLDTDSYKVSMLNQYPNSTEYVFSYVEPRGGDYTEVVVAGTQPFVKDLAENPFSIEELEFANAFWTEHGEPFPFEMFKKMYNKYGGYWPVEIRAPLDGTVVPIKNLTGSVINTDPEMRLATTWLETGFLRAQWYASTVATNSREIKKVIKSFLEKSGDPSGIAFKLHDFGSRAASSFETAGLGGMSHLINFMGTDTMTANLFVKKYYGDGPIAGYSIPASEHSTITSWTRAKEKEAYRNMIRQFGKPGAILACVSDSYDIFKACHMWGELKDEIVASGAKLVVRPDSGDPIATIRRCLDILDSYFGHTVNSKGYKVLNNVGMIWGDGITKTTIKQILTFVVDIDKWSADNLAYGQGGALLQAVTRDDMSWAMKCSAAKINCEWIDVYKDPVTDKGKRSKRGVMGLYQTTNGVIYTDRVDSGITDNRIDCVVYNNGETFNTTSFADVRRRAELI